MLTRRATLVFGVANVLTAGLVALGVFAGLPARWWPVDTGAAVIVVLELVSGFGLLRGARWAGLATQIASVVALALGLVVVSLLAVTASWLSGVYGPVGKGGAIILALVAALTLPYAVVLPVVELAWLRAGKKG
jgi:hypothetical protein